MELRHLRILSQVEASGSIRKAARALCLAQPALTAQVKRIEKELGGAVFTRSRDGVRLTELGRYVIGSGRELLADFDRLVAETSALARRTAGSRPLRLAAMAELDLPTMLTTLADLLPSVSVATSTVPTLTEGARALGAGEVDAALLFAFPGAECKLPEEVGYLDIVPVEPAFVAFPADHPLADRAEVPLCELAGESWIAADDPEECGRERLFHRACERSGFVPRIRHRALSCEIVLPLVRRGEGVALVHPLCTPPPDIVFRPLAGSPVSRSISLCWQRSSVVDARIPVLVERLAEAYHLKVGRRPVYRDWWLAHEGPLRARVPEGSPAPAPCLEPLVALGGCLC
ncbi:LysR family transcriptional regulator [Streptomyces physcomitrii]|uniref:LysR family transcriptional regulator n=1 Tax=Streptomyces physcomitrii TaxID=2724184 RepID=A0ABX1HAN2_9ACTN|nr:LysR family transcriptional regulator [Streptomyces physcomitrii]NKI45462.1 LysR family transcriptional regulator [Streptomyces physcomitrii]